MGCKEGCRLLSRLRFLPNPLVGTPPPHHHLDPQVALVAVELRSLSGDKVEVDAMVRAVLAILGCGGLPEEPPDPSHL